MKTAVNWCLSFSTNVEFSRMKYVIEDFLFSNSSLLQYTRASKGHFRNLLTWKMLGCLTLNIWLWQREKAEKQQKKIRWKYSLVSQHNPYQQLSWSVPTFIVSCRWSLERNAFPHGFKTGFSNLLSLPLFPAWRDWEAVLLSKSGWWIPRGCSSNLQSYSSS